MNMEYAQRPLTEAAHEEIGRLWRAENNRKVEVHRNMVETQQRRAARRKEIAESAEQTDTCIRRVCWLCCGAAVAGIGCGIGAVTWWFAAAIALAAATTSAIMLGLEIKRLWR